MKIYSAFLLGELCLAGFAASLVPFSVLAQELENRPLLGVELYPGIRIEGRAGERYRIEYCSDPTSGEQWQTLAEIELPSDNYVFHDPEPVRNSRRFYRAVALGPPVPGQLDFTYIPSGRFLIGSPETEEGRYENEGPVTEVTITRGFLVGRREVTQREFETVMGYNPSVFTGNPRLPVENVTWEEAVLFCEKLTERERAAGRLPPGYVYRLPTEAEWEYACRAGTTTRFGWGDSADEAMAKRYAWYNLNAMAEVWTEPHAAAEGPQETGAKEPNNWTLYDAHRNGGLYDMHGNVWEWCLDAESPYPGGAVEDWQGTAPVKRRICRGGAWNSDLVRDCRSARRRAVDQTARDSSTGFRLVLGPVANQRLVWIPPGTFVVGSPPCEDHRDPDEQPMTLIRFTYGFWMSKYETTQREYESVMGANPSMFRGDPDRPVENVTWRDALAYCQRLTQREHLAGRLPQGHVYRLPTEFEWEYACRAGTTTLFSFGFDRCTRWLDYVDTLCEYAWTSHNSGGQTHPVGTRKPNPWGLFDMHGNVWEWCLNPFVLYPGGHLTVTVGEATNDLPFQCIRGGAWHIDAQGCRTADRQNWFSDKPVTPYGSFGFRVVLAPTYPTPAR